MASIQDTDTSTKEHHSPLTSAQENLYGHPLPDDHTSRGIGKDIANQYDLDYYSDTASECSFLSFEASELHEESHKKSISSPLKSIELQTVTPSRLLSNRYFNSEPVSRGRTRARANSDSALSENLFAPSVSRASSLNTDSLTERSESIFSPLSIRHHQQSRHGSPSPSQILQPTATTSEKPPELKTGQSDDDIIVLNLVPCLQCLTAGLRCSLAIRRQKDRTYCIRCRQNDDKFCITRRWAGYVDGQKTYTFVTLFDDIRPEEFEKRVKDLVNKKWEKEKFALPKPPEGYREQLRKWMEVSEERE